MPQSIFSFAFLIRYKLGKIFKIFPIAAEIAPNARICL